MAKPRKHGPLGNLTPPNPNAAANWQTNHISHGNALQFESNNLGYDMANRLVSVNGTQVYAYDQGNHRVYSNASGAETIYLYRLGGRKLATYQATVSNTAITLTFLNANVYFAGQLVDAEATAVAVDGVGSVRWSSATGRHTYYPYGVEYSAQTNDTEKYATYTRDSVSGLDYAMNRYYTSQFGRFMSPDPSSASMNLSNPGSLNRYAYVNGDPINGNDPLGLDGGGGPTAFCAAVSGLAFTAALTGPPGSCGTLAIAAFTQGWYTFTSPTGPGLSQASTITVVDPSAVDEAIYSQIMGAGFWYGQYLLCNGQDCEAQVLASAYPYMACITDASPCSALELAILPYNWFPLPYAGAPLTPPWAPNPTAPTKPPKWTGTPALPFPAPPVPRGPRDVTLPVLPYTADN